MNFVLSNFKNDCFNFRFPIQFGLLLILNCCGKKEVRGVKKESSLDKPNIGLATFMDMKQY